MNTTPDNEITINVVGYSATGKSTIQLLIADTLRSYGFNVNVNVTPDYKDEQDLRYYHKIYGEDILESIHKKIKQINVNEVRAQRSIVGKSKF